jgi:5-methylcytosine-specific restriction protein A
MLDEKAIVPIIKKLIAQTGLQLDWRLENNQATTRCIILPSGIHQAEGFRVVVTPGWKSIETKFFPGNLARELLHDMEHARKDKKLLFSSMTTYIRDAGGILNLEINNKQVSPENPEDWPERWSQLQILLRSRPVDSDVDLRIDPSLPIHIYKWTSFIFSLIMELLPLEENVEDEIDPIEQLEGTSTTVISKRYERNPANRMACIAIHGSRCKICGFDFGRVYGEIGEGFIHVHHLTPVSQVGAEGMFFDPLIDLIPVCPNCHSMLHKRNPPFSIEEMEKIISGN